MKKTILLALLWAQMAVAAPLKLALNWKPEPQFGGFYSPLLSDTLKKKKIDLQIQPGGSGTPTLQMLMSGQVEYAVVSADEVVIAAARGNDQVIALFAVYQTNPQAVMMRTSNPATSWEQLAAQSDLTLLWQEGLPYAQFLKKKFTPWKLKTAPYPGGITNFMANEKIIQQCFVTSEPLLAKKQKLEVKTLLVADAGYNPYTTVVATTKKRLQEKESEVREVVEAVRKGWQQYLDQPLGTNKKMVQLNPGMDLPMMNDSADVQKALIVKDGQALGEMTHGRWEELIQQLHELKVIEIKPLPENLFRNLK